MPGLGVWGNAGAGIGDAGVVWVLDVDRSEEKYKLRHK